MSLFKEFKKSKNVNVWKELDSICSGENYIRDEARSEIKQGELFQSFTSEEGNDQGKESEDDDKTPEDLINEAKRRAEQIEQEAYEKGFSQGEKDGFQLGQQKAKKLVEQIRDLLREFDGIRDQILKNHESEIISLIYVITEKMVYEKIEEGDYNLKGIIVKALEELSEKSRLTIRISNDDYELVQSLMPDIRSQIKELRNIDLVPDASISKAGCIIDSPCGFVDATIESRLKNIRECLQKVYAGLVE